MKQVMDKVKALYDTVVKKDEELCKLQDNLKGQSKIASELESELAIKANGLLAREAKVKEVENVLDLLDEAKKLKQEAAEENANAVSVKKEASNYIENEKRKMEVELADIAAAKRNMASQQESLNKEALRLKDDYAKMRQKVMQEIKGMI